jgi:hypothetical protein
MILNKFGENLSKSEFVRAHTRMGLHTTSSQPASQPAHLSVKHMQLVVNEWLLFNANSAIFQLYHGENKLIFNEMMMRSALY